MLSAPSAERIGPRKMKLSPYDAKYDFVRVQVLAEELRRAGLGSRAQELLQALAAIVGRALLEAVRPAVDLDALVDAGLVHRLVGDEFVRRRAVVELHEERRAERVAAVVGDEMAVADDALAEILDVALLLRAAGARRVVRRPGLVPAIDRPLRRLGAVVVLQRLPAAIRSADRPADIRSCFQLHPTDYARRGGALENGAAGQTMDRHEACPSPKHFCGSGDRFRVSRAQRSASSRCAADPGP